ncbi:MAG: hypothetical protein RI907_1287 [Pseudomonadota bacterium]|jgi:hypothetical protein
MTHGFRTLTAGLLMALVGVGAQAQVTIAVADGGFEASYTSYATRGADGHVVFTYQPTGGNQGWGYAAGTGVASSYDALSAFEGNSFAFVQNETEKFGQLITVDQTARASTTFALALRPGYSAGQVVGIMVDGQQVAQVAATATSWSIQNIDLGILTAGVHTFGFRGLNPNHAPDTTAFIDAVKLSASPVPEASSLALAGVGAILVAALRRRRA